MDRHTKLAKVRRERARKRLRRRVLHRRRRIVLNWLERLRGSEQTFLVLYASLIGALAGGTAVVFRIAIAALWEVFFGSASVGLASRVWPQEWRFLAPAVGGLAVGLSAVLLFGETRMRGVPEVVEKATVGGGAVPLQKWLSTFLHSALTIGSGGSSGREGPIVTMGAAVGSLVGRIFRLSTQRRRVTLGCGAAGGIAAAFNAPLAGVFFSLEVILGDFQVRTLSPIVLSSVVGTVVARALEGKVTAFSVPAYDLVAWREILFYAVLGVLSGLIARGFVLAHQRAALVFEAIPIPEWSKPALGGLLVGMLGIYLPQVYGNGYPAMQQALAGDIALGLLCVLVAAKSLATAITLGSGGWGGDLAPSLFVGAMLGGAVGQVVHEVATHLTAAPGAYALVGMGAVLAAVIHAPITSILMLFELTNNYLVILPVMTACILSTAVYRRFSPLSIYGEALASRGIFLSDGREVRVMQDLRVRDVMNEQVETVGEDAPFGEILQRLTGSDQLYFPVTDGDGRLLGVLNFHHYRDFLFERELVNLVVAGELMDSELAFVYPDDSVQTAIEVFHERDWDELPVVERSSRRVIGRLGRRQVIDAYNREIVKRRWMA